MTDDIVEDHFVLLMVAGEPAVCDRCGRQLAEGELYTLNEDNQVVCSNCEVV